MKSIVGEIAVNGELGSWELVTTCTRPEDGLELIELTLTSPVVAAPPKLRLSWEMPLRDIQFRWHPAAGSNRQLCPDWAGTVDSALPTSAPVVLLGNINGENRMTFAVSEALRNVRILAGVNEGRGTVACAVEFFRLPEAPLCCYSVTLRLDRRPLFYARSLEDVSAWWASFPDYAPALPPAAAFEPIYSSWYSYHQEIFQAELEEECRLAADYGMRGIIVDDGWQTDDNNRGYAYCGDWEISHRRFPDMANHVRRVQQPGMKYMVWFSVPFVGTKSRNAARFQGKYLYLNERLKAYVLDPRFPEVREFLIATYERAIREWGIDGLKLDFIDNFIFVGEDPALGDDYAGRDIKSLPAAVDCLLSDTMRRLNVLKPGVLIEFRQNYIGPAIRKYGNMFRAGDCPDDIISNRFRTLDLRLTSGNTAVHSDMLEWNFADTPEVAALQFLNILFSVPQISVRLADMPEEHRRMLHFWLDFWRGHRDVLLRGKLTPLHPEQLYPQVWAESATETVCALYQAGMVVALPEGNAAGHFYVVNATGRSGVTLDLPRKARQIEMFDVQGKALAATLPPSGLSHVVLPPSGLLHLTID